MDKIISCCGMVCSGCGYYPADCPGCPALKGRPFWLEYTGGAVCDIYACCVEGQHLAHCGLCAELPCARWDTEDPTRTQEENAAIQEQQLALLRDMAAGKAQQTKARKPQLISIAIDGPSGAGKSSLSRALAQRFGYIYVDTGALYRSIGLAVLRADKNTKDEAAVSLLLPEIDVTLRFVNGEQRVFLGEEDVSEAIRAEDVSMAASDVSAHPPVRAFLLETQRGLARRNNVIMDGRDIGTVVLPDATIKIFLTASVDDRATRRYEQLLRGGQKADYETVKADVVQRDYNDSHRAAAPLKKAEDAVEVITTGFAFEQSLAKLEEVIRALLQREAAT